LRELIEREPGECGVLVAGWFAGDSSRHESDQERGAGVCNAELRFIDTVDVDAQFFGEFPAGGRLVRLVWFDLAAGEFPQTPVALVRRALANQKAAVPSDHGCSDTN
jgi:hypothetical protein